jgi:hypothetical protein
MLLPLCVALLLAAVAVGGCTTAEPRPLPAACLRGPEEVHRALAAAPGPVRLDGTPLSDCVSRARSQSDLQNVGAILTRVAEDLERLAPKNAGAALQLGYLAGAARRGAPHTSSLQAELVRRLERSTALEHLRPRMRSALARGASAGRTGG